MLFLFQRSITGLIAAIVLACCGAYVARADESATLDVPIVVADAGAFAVSLAGVNDTEPTFGAVQLDAVTDESVLQTFVLEYTDTHLSRGPGDVTLSIDSFSPVSPVPPFTGSDQALFQIPNRYLTLTDVRDVVPDASDPGCTPGPITAVTSGEGQSFDMSAQRTVASVAAGCGVGSANQEIDLTLTVPAGVYPTTYSATVTIETTVASTP